MAPVEKLKKPSYVYFIGPVIQPGSALVTKIGMTDNLHSRLKGLSSSSPHMLHIYAVLVYNNRFDAGEAEGLLHKNLAAYRLSGEWFSGTPAQNLERAFEWIPPPEIMGDDAITSRTPAFRLGPYAGRGTPPPKYPPVTGWITRYRKPGSGNVHKSYLCYMYG